MSSITMQQVCLLSFWIFDTFIYLFFRRSTGLPAHSDSNSEAPMISVLIPSLLRTSLITADLTKRFNRKLFAVPGQLTSSVSQGTLQLIKEGADIVTSADDILAVYGLKQTECPKNIFAGLSKLEQNIVQKLAQEPRGIDFLSRLLNISAAELGATLSLMLLRGIIGEEEGKYYVG